jgi:threonine dehydrogenase-like Zn-dependent dehydrogenase
MFCERKRRSDNDKTVERTAHSVKTRQIVVVKGVPLLEEAELGQVAARCLRVRTRFSGVSQGTELAIVRRNALEEAAATPLGYQAVGQVVQLGPETEGFAPGMWVACYGAPYVRHASVFDVPVRLAAPVAPEFVLPGLSFCGLGTIALHALRLGRLTLGEVATVVGLGAVGNLLAQLACAAGAQVLAVDTNVQRAQRATSCGVAAVAGWGELKREVQGRSEGNGADAVFLATNACGNDLLEACVRLVRLGGRIVVVGNAEAVLPREMLFEKEATVVVSRAGGPGRYDPQYEAGPTDYPYAWVRWTEGRNLREFVRQATAGAIKVEPLMTTVASPTECASLYAELSANGARHLGVVFDWETAE